MRTTLIRRVTVPVLSILAAVIGATSPAYAVYETSCPVGRKKAPVKREHSRYPEHARQRSMTCSVTVNTYAIEDGVLSYGISMPADLAKK
jgi:hypothetical protein